MSHTRPQYHADRQTGSLSRAIDRGTKGINFLMMATLFHIVPTTLEIGLVCGILTYNFGGSFALTAAGTLGVYTAFTLTTT